MSWVSDLYRFKSTYNIDFNISGIGNKNHIINFINDRSNISIVINSHTTILEELLRNMTAYNKPSSYYDCVCRLLQTSYDCNCGSNVLKENYRKHMKSRHFIAFENQIYQSTKNILEKYSIKTYHLLFLDIYLNISRYNIMGN